jgi:hypothetical protein
MTDSALEVILEISWIFHEDGREDSRLPMRRSRA